MVDTIIAFARALTSEIRGASQLIPDFDSNLVLPPHLGNPTVPDQLSPYPCTTLELCEKFATTPPRKIILGSLLSFRELLTRAGIVDGFQWLGGSFLEDKERREGKAPNDLDVATMTFTHLATQQAAAAANPILMNPDEIKRVYHLDHYLTDIGYNPLYTVEFSRYWFGLFSHRRDRIWKGMLRIELNTPAVDQKARDYLANNP